MTGRDQEARGFVVVWGRQSCCAQRVSGGGLEVWKHHEESTCWCVWCFAPRQTFEAFGAPTLVSQAWAPEGKTNLFDKGEEGAGGLMSCG